MELYPSLPFDLMFYFLVLGSWFLVLIRVSFRPSFPWKQRTLGDLITDPFTKDNKDTISMVTESDQGLL